MATAPAAPPVLPPIVARIAGPADIRLDPRRTAVGAMAAAHRAAGANVRKRVAATAGGLAGRAMRSIATSRSHAMMVRGQAGRTRTVRAMMVRAMMVRAMMVRALGLRAMRVHVLGLRAMRVHVLAANPPRTAAHRVGNFSRARPGRQGPSGFQLRRNAIVNRTPHAPHLMRRRAPSGCMATMPWPLPWPTQTAACAGCC
jgi:predicted regulator of Ras-like GTPase activity (Roadblock/LC7/MglB family)